jgi:hypothetical protein
MAGALLNRVAAAAVDSFTMVMKLRRLLTVMLKPLRCQQTIRSALEQVETVEQTALAQVL